ncbi:MAG: hypothetical protein Q8P12_01410, partial [bacterium]|nr:hypothetical protein [bacterium]
MKEAEGASQIGGLEPFEKEELDNLVIYANEGAQKYVFEQGEIREVEDYRKGSLTEREAKEKVQQIVRGLLNDLREKEMPLTTEEAPLVKDWTVLQKLAALVKNESTDWFDRDAIFSFKYKGFVKAPETKEMRILLRDVLLKRLKESGIEDLDILLGGKSTVSIVPKGIDKATAIEDLLENADSEMLVYFGDEFTPDGNDDAVRRYRLDAVNNAGKMTVVSVGVDKQGEALNPEGTVWIGKGPAATERVLTELSGAEGDRGEAFRLWASGLSSQPAASSLGTAEKPAELEPLLDLTDQQADEIAAIILRNIADRNRDLRALHEKASGLNPRFQFLAGLPADTIR